jgi:hypothetical protein
MIARRVLIASAFLALMTFMHTPFQAAVPNVRGTYTTLAKQGTIAFTAVKRVVQYGYQGNFRIDERTYSGSMYFPRTG